MKLTDTVVKAFGVAKVFRDNTDLINSLDFSDNGELLVTSADDDQIIIYDCNTGTTKKTLNSKKYGCSLIRFTHAPNTAVHGSTKIDDTIRYLSLHDNKYIRYFPGHTKRVVCLCMSPTDDTFLSGSLDKTIRLWDLRSPNCQGLMHLNSRPVAAFDPEGLIFAAGIGSESLKLYDLRSFDRGPFTTFKVGGTEGGPPPSGYEWTGLRFSPDGRSMLVMSNTSSMRMVDSYDGRQIAHFGGYANNKGMPLEATFSPDSQYVFSGSTDGKLHAWGVESGKIAIMDSQHQKPIQNVLFNPKFMLLVSACQILTLWVPEIDE